MTALNGLAAIPVAELRPSPNNPRERMTGIDELALSIRENGLIQPIIVQRIPGERGFQIIAGHRRFAAALRLGLATVLCVIRRDMLPDEELLAMLVENGQRAGLDPIEEARALNKLKNKMGISEAEVARRIGRPASHVAGRIMLLALPVANQEEVGGILRPRRVAAVAAAAGLGLLVTRTATRWPRRSPTPTVRLTTTGTP